MQLLIDLPDELIHSLISNLIQYPKQLFMLEHSCTRLRDLLQNQEIYVNKLDCRWDNIDEKTKCNSYSRIYSDNDYKIKDLLPYVSHCWDSYKIIPKHIVLNSYNEEIYYLALMKINARMVERLDYYVGANVAISTHDSLFIKIFECSNLTTLSITHKIWYLLLIDSLLYRKTMTQLRTLNIALETGSNVVHYRYHWLDNQIMTSKCMPKLEVINITFNEHEFDIWATRQGRGIANFIITVIESCYYKRGSNKHEPYPLIINHDSLKEVSIIAEGLWLTTGAWERMKTVINNNMLKYYVEQNRKIDYTIDNQKLVAKIESL